MMIIYNYFVTLTILASGLFYVVYSFARENSESLTPNYIEQGKNNGLHNYNPDFFEGDDSQKIQQALDALTEFGGTICIDRDYTLTRDILITNNSNNHRSITILGVAGNLIFTNGYKFTAEGDNKRDQILMGGIQFSNIRFSGKGNDICFDMDALIRLRFNMCYFYNYNIVFKSQKELVQDIVCQMCTFRGINDHVLYSKRQTFECIFNQCTVEASRNFIYLGTFTAGCRITDSCIEGLSGYVAKIDGYALGVTFQRNYFEQNATNKNVDAWFDLSKVTEPRSLTISDNIFAGINKNIGNMDVPIIKLPSSRIDVGLVEISKNALNDRTNNVTPLVVGYKSSKCLKISDNIFSKNN